MPDSIMYYEDHFVLLSPDMQQQFVNLAELSQKLRSLLTEIRSGSPSDIDTEVADLLKTACELEVVDGRWQWYAVRLEK